MYIIYLLSFKKVIQFQGENTTYSSPRSSVGAYPTQFSESCSLKNLSLNTDLTQPSRCTSSQLELAELQAIFCSCCANTYFISLPLLLPLQNRNNSSSKRPNQTILAVRLCMYKQKIHLYSKGKKKKEILLIS